MGFVKVSLVVIMVSFATKPLVAQKFYFHRQRTCNQFSLPDYDFSGDKRVSSKSIISKADFAQPSSRSTASSEKRFHIPTSAIATDRVTFRNIGIHINDAGEIRVTGTLSHNGGLDGGLTGSNIKITVKGMAGVANAEKPDDGLVVWKLEKQVWCYKNRNRTVAFENSALNLEEFKRVFQQITHVEIELQHEIDR